MSLQEKFGCSHEYILWCESWANLQMKIADMPGIARKSKKAIETENDLKDFLDKHI